jgi:type II secretory pathway component PulC
MHPLDMVAQICQEIFKNCPKMVQNCPTIVKQLNKKVVSCRKKLSKSCQKIVKNLVVQKLLKNFTIFFHKIVKPMGGLVISRA